ncbi:apolipophorin [Biomphalaria glabrata]|nr:apolipophorin [Biomphalaria glabrata]
METKLLICLALIASSNAGPTWRSNNDDDSSCALECKNNARKFQYAPSTTYIYDYVVDTETTMAGATEDSAKLSIKTQAEIQSIDGCEFALSLKKTRISHSEAFAKDLKAAEREDEFRQLVEGYTLRFSFDDGIIASVCPDEYENTWALNFKRGLLSAFQNSMANLDSNDRVTEIDVTGECKAEYNVSKSWGAWNKDTTVTKSKNLRACTNRDGYKSFLQTTPYKIISDIQSLPIIRSTHMCSQVISSAKLLKSVTCEEKHIYVPFSNDQSGGKTIVRQSLILAAQKSTVDAGRTYVSSRQSLLFEHSFVPEQTQNKMESATQTLKEICEQTVEDLRPETPRMFSELVTVLRMLDSSNLKHLHRLLKDKKLCPENGRTIKFFLDALPMAETEGAVDLMTTLIINKDVEGLLAKAWMTSLALIQNPSISMIESALGLLDSNYDDAAFPVSSLVNNYCKKHTNCGNTNGVIEVVKKLTSKIQRSCYVNEKNAGDVMKTLRALGNTGRSGIVSTALNSCLQSSSAPVEIRAMAADAFRNIPCDDNFDQTDSQLWAILNKPSEPFELRIFSYLAVMRCPSSDNLDKIVQLLEEEKDEQLGSYITSHLNNLKQTSDPHKQEISAAIQKLTYKEFTTSALKFSKNFEASFLVNKLNLGLVADSDVISGLDSPLPRYAKANFSLELFGNSINILEMGGRVEGVEALAEKLLGPYFSGNKDKSKDKVKDIKGFAYARLFGNELFFQHFSGVEGLLKSRNVPNFLDYMIQLAKRQEVAISHSQQLMDVSLVIPTIAGLPLNISVNGSINFDLKAEGKADLRQVAAAPRSLDIDGEFKPSAALEITGTMAVDGLVAKLGLRMRNTMHSSTGIKGRIHINKGRELSIEIEPPKDKMEIFNAKSQFFIVHNEVEKEQEMIKTNYKQYKWCTEILAVEFCGDVQFPNASTMADAPYFPLTGPVKVNVMSFRKDTHTAYKFYAQRTESKDKSTAHFLLNTLGSKVNRMISADVTIGYAPKQLDVIINSPWRKLNLNGGMETNKDIYSLVGSILIDDVDKYGFTTEMKMSKKGSSAVYKPLVQTTYKGNTRNLISGQVELDTDTFYLPNKVLMDLKVQAYSGTPYNFKTYIVNNNKEKRFSTELSYGSNNAYIVNIGTTYNGKDFKNFQVNPEVKIQTPSAVLLSLTGTGDYKAEKSLSGNLTLNILKQKPAQFSLSMSNGMWGKIDMKLKSILATGDIKIENNLKKSMQKTSSIKVNYFIPNLGKDSFKVDIKYQDKSTKSFSKYTLSSKTSHIKNSDYNLDLTVNVDHKDKRSQAESIIKYGADPKNTKKIINLSYVFKMDSFSLKDADIDLQVSATVPEKNIESNLKVAHNHDEDDLTSSLKLKLLPYIKNNIAVSVNLKNSNQKSTKLQGSADLEFSGKKFTFNTDLNQKLKNQYVHTADFSGTSLGTHSITTVYNIKNDAYDVISDVNLDGYDPIKLRGNLSLGSSNYGASLNGAYGRDEYGVTVQTKYIENRFGKLDLTLVHPDRQIIAAGEAKILSGKYEGSALVNWNAAKKNTKDQASVEGIFSNIVKGESTVISGDVKIKTPFEFLYDEINSKVVLTSDAKKISTTSRLSWGKLQRVSSSMYIYHPISLSNVKMNLNVETPYRAMKELNFEIDHTLDTDLSTTVRGKLNDDKGELILIGENKGSSYKNDLSTSLNLKTTVPLFNDISLALSHSDDSANYQSSGTFSYNGDKYETAITMSHSLIGYNVKNSGKLRMSWPTDSLETTWTHDNTDTRRMNCAISTTWNNNRKTMTVTFDGSNFLSRGERQSKASLEIKTPWQEVRNLKVDMNQQHSSMRLLHKLDIKKNNAAYGNYEYLLERDTGSINTKFLVKLPQVDTIHGQTTVKYERFPASTSFWLEWAPSSRIDFDGSLNAPSIELIELDTKLSTPFRNVENLVFKVSHKVDNAEYVSTAVLDYSVRKQIQLLNRFQLDDNIIAWRTTFTTPCKHFKLLNYGLKVDMTDDKFDGSADFELQPLVQKYTGQLNWFIEDGEYDGKLTLNTPLRNLPDFQITSWRKEQDDGSKTTHVDVSSSPYGKYMYDATYTTEAPYSLDIQIKTPHVNYETLGLTMTYNPTAGALQSKLDIIYLMKKELTVDLNLNWKNKIDVSLILNTPLKYYRNNRLTFSHETTRSGFLCRIDSVFGVSPLKGDASYARVNDMVTGSASLALPGLQKFEGKFKLTGGLKDMKGDANVKLGYNTVSTDFSNLMKSNLYKTTFNLYTPYTEDLKVEFKHDDKSNRNENKFDTSFNAQYGDYERSARLSVSCSGLKTGQFDFTLKGPSDSLVVSLNHEITGDKVVGSSKIESSIDSIGNIEFSLAKEGSLQDMTASAKLVRNREQLVDTSVQNKWDNTVTGKFNVRGKWVPTIQVLHDHKGSYSNFNNKVRVTVDGKVVLDKELSAKFDDKIMDVTGKMNYALGTEEHKHSLSIHKEGDFNNLKLTINKKCDGQESKITIELQTDDQVKNLVHIENFMDYGFIGYELEHSGDFDKFLTNVKVYMTKDDIITGRVDFFKYGTRRVEFTGELTTPFDGYTNSKIEYRHEGQDNRMSCNINLKYGDSKIYSSDLIIQREPSMSLSFNVKTPYRGYEQLLLSSNFDGKTFNGHAILGRGREIKTSGVSGSQYELTTTFDQLKQVTINLDGKLTDGSADFVLLAGNKRMSGKAKVLYNNMDSLSASAELVSNVKNLEALKFLVKKAASAGSKTYHAEFSWDPEKQVVIDSKYSNSNFARSLKKEHAFELDIKLPYEALREINLDVNYNSVGQNALGSKLSLDVNQDKIIDLDVDYRNSDQHEVSVVVRKPWPQEYIVTADLKEDKSSDIFINWDKDVATSNFRIKSGIADSSSGSDIDIKMNMEVTYRSRSVGMEQTFTNTDATLLNSGRIYWDNKEDSRIMYSININGGSSSNTREFKVGFPSRTLILKGSSSRVGSTQNVDATFGWDMDRDDTKVIGLTASVYNQDYTQADITVKMPSDLKVSSAVTFNRGNTIFEGTTAFSYNSDSRKTLTLFSTVKNSPYATRRVFQSAENNYNYSVQLGVKHPETKVDIKIDSHLGKRANVMTSSMGVRYLTSTSQIKNLALFAEINELKKEMNLVAATSSNNVGLSTRIINDEPLQVELATTVNGQQSFKSMVDSTDRAVNLIIGEVSFNAKYNNASSVTFEINMLNDGNKISDAALTFTLVKPKLLQSSLIWKPKLLANFRKWLINEAVRNADDFKVFLRQLNNEVRNELVAKHRDISSFLVETLKLAAKDAETELNSLAVSMDQLQQSLTLLRRNSDGYASLQNLIKRIQYDFQKLIQSYKSVYRNAISSITASLDQVKQYLVAINYRETVTDTMETTFRVMDNVIIAFTDFIQKDIDFSPMKSLSDKAMQSTEELKKELESIKKTVLNLDLGDIVTRKLSFLNEYKTSIENVQKKIISQVPEQLKETLQIIFGELIHQVDYLSRYLEIKSTLKNHINFAIQLINDIALEDLTEFIDNLKEMLKDPIVAFDLENGRIILNVPLPMALERLDHLPKLSDSINNANQFIQKYLPNRESFPNIYQYVWNGKNRTDDIIKTELNDFEPLRRRILPSRYRNVILD